MTILYLLLLLALGIYSYSQIDLNLTLSSQKLFLDFQYWLIQLGYFNRPLSTVIFIVLTLLLFGFYVFFLRKITKTSLIILIAAVAILGAFSYPSFSHDIFNYIFDARIFVVHHANPYTSTALMFPNDTWTRFMNWTHRTYPYGPFFLPLTVVVYLLGMNKFVLTLFLFKSLMTAAFLGSGYYLYKLAGNKAVALFALNPLIVYEVLVAGHMDILMLFFALLAIYKRSKLILLVSAGIKYATILFLPVFFKLKIEWLVVAAYLGAALQIFSRELLPHYFIVPLGISALLPENKYLVWLGGVLSLSLILARYYPFLSTGQWVPLTF